MLKYKSYFGNVEFDDEADIFHGEVVNISDVVTFQGKTTKELRQAFEDSINDYLEFCAATGKEPEKPFSGRLLFRTSPELHKRFVVAATKAHMSLNQWIENILNKAAT